MNSPYDLYNNVEARRALSPVSVSDNTAQVSQIIDMQGRNSLLWVLVLGSLADADATFAVTMDHGDAANLSDAASVSSADMLGTLAGASFTFSADDTVKKIGYIGTKRYVRLTITPSSNASAALLSVVAILSGAIKGPLS